METQPTTKAGSGHNISDAELNQWIIQSAVEQFAPVVTEGKTKEVEVEQGKPPVPMPVTPEERIAQAKQIADSLVIAGIEDKENYKTAKTYLTVAKKWRTGVEAKRKELKAVSLEYGRKVDGEAKRLTALVEPVEKTLADKIAAIDQAAEIARMAEELRRHKLMTENGWQFTGSWYVCGITNLTQGDLAAATEDKLAELVATGKAELQRIAAEEARKAEEAAAAAALAKQQAEENERLRKELEAMKAAQKTPAPEFQPEPPAPQPTITVQRTTGPAYTVKESGQSPRMFEGHPRPAGFEVAPEIPADDMAGMFAAATIGPGVTEPEPEPEFVKPKVGTVTAFDYEKGFNDCRNQILELFGDGVKRTRDQWIQIFQNLKPRKP